MVDVAHVVGVIAGLYFLLVMLMLCRSAAHGDECTSAAHLGESGSQVLDPRDVVDAAILEAQALDVSERACGLAVTPAVRHTRHMQRISGDVWPGQRVALISGVLVERGSLVRFAVLPERDAMN